MKPEAERSVYELTRCALPLAFAETAADNEEALRLLSKALAMDGGSPTTNALAAWCHQQRHLMDWPPATEHSRREAVRLAHVAIANGSDVALALAVAGVVCAVLTRDHDTALAAVDRASMLNPTAAIILGFDALTQCLCAAYTKAIERAERALQLSPFEPLAYHAALALALAHLLSGRADAAIAYAHRAIEGNRNFALSYCALALCHARLGRVDQAEQAVRQLAQAAPGFHLRSLRRMGWADAAHLLSDLELLCAHIPD